MGPSAVQRNSWLSAGSELPRQHGSSTVNQAIALLVDDDASHGTERPPGVKRLATNGR